MRLSLVESRFKVPLLVIAVETVSCLPAATFIILKAFIVRLAAVNPVPSAICDFARLISNVLIVLVAAKLIVPTVCVPEAGPVPCMVIFVVPATAGIIDPLPEIVPPTPFVALSTMDLLPHDRVALLFILRSPFT